MSLRRPSSCDFITRLPVCEREAFPILRDYTRDEVRTLKTLVQDPWYQAAKSQSRYLRAVLVEQKLGTMSLEEQFWLLQQGHFYDPANTYGNPTYFAAFRDVANAYQKEASAEDKQFILLAAAFARVHSSEPQKALSILKSEAAMDFPEHWLFTPYAELVRACVKTPKAERCASDHEVRFSD